MKIEAVEGALDRLEAVEGALDRLEADGARAFDAPACDCMRTLIAHAETADGAVADHLLRRVDVHLHRLRASFAAARDRVRAELAGLETERQEFLPDLHEQLARGDVTRVGRAIRRVRHRPPAPSAVTVSTALAYEDAVAELVASFALARAIDVVPGGAGPYNALRIASVALDTMRAISPYYLTVQLNRLEELASLLSLPELATAEPTPLGRSLPKKRRRSDAR